MPFGPASLLGVESFDTDAVVELLPGDDDLKKAEIIRATYRQVLGNAYVMDSERDLITESQFKLGELSVRELVRKLAKSDLYRTRFFDSCSRYRYIELAFRHLLGRAPTDYEEMRGHSDTLDSAGFEKDIDTFIDSKEYQDTFGEWIVPYQRGWKTESCGTMQEFTWNFQLLRGNSSSSLKGDLSGPRFSVEQILFSINFCPCCQGQSMTNRFLKWRMDFIGQAAVSRDDSCGVRKGFF